MINYRTIFNPSYNYVGLLLIGIIIFLLFITIKDFSKTIKQIGKISIISGIITFLTAVILNFIINQLLPHQYKIFIQVISKNIYKEAFTSSIIVIVLGALLLLIEKVWNKPERRNIKTT